MQGNKLKEEQEVASLLPYWGLGDEHKFRASCWIQIKYNKYILMECEQLCRWVQEFSDLKNKVEARI